MNAFEKRQAEKKFKNRIRYLKLKDMKLEQIGWAERYYISAFTALNGQPPMTLPKGNSATIMMQADVMFARCHEIEMGGDDDQV